MEQSYLKNTQDEETHKAFQKVFETIEKKRRTQYDSRWEDVML